MMKRMGFLLVGLMALLLVGCGPQHSPENTVKAYYNALLEENFDGASHYIQSDRISSENIVARNLAEIYSKDNKIVSFSVLGAGYSTKDKAQVAIAYEIAKAPKGSNTKDVIMLDLVKIDGKWFITF